MGLALQAWEAVTPERDLGSVLEAVSDVLLPAIAFDGIGIVIFAREEHRRLYKLHLVNQSQGRQSTPPTPRPVQPYEPGAPMSSGDLHAKTKWFPHEFRLASAGIRAYVALPLHIQSRQAGVAVFGRRKPNAFSPEDIQTLREVSRALSVAVANALAYDEIRSLRDQLEQENIALKEQLGQVPWAEGLIGKSSALRSVLEAVDQVGDTDATVLITGETGTGKELIAKAIHRRSRRAAGPLVKVNCSAIPAGLLASELFGHERGAFTGAMERHKGRFEQARGGTLFLDEIAEISAEMQVLLLRVLQEREFERLGGSATLTADVRVVAATNRNLAEEVRAGSFREDLFYRLNVFPLHLPPLRERMEDIPLLIAHFSAKHGTRHNRAIERVERRTMRDLQSYPWPGNIRELENIVERAVIVSRGGLLKLPPGALPGTTDLRSLPDRLRSEEREAIESALRASQGRISGTRGAAATLGIPPSTLESRLQRLGIDKLNWKSRPHNPRESA